MVLVKSSVTGKEGTRMRYSNQGWFREQASFLRRQFLQDGDLPFSNVLSEEVVAQSHDESSDRSSIGENE
jgi:hypothetical protein